MKFFFSSSVIFAGAFVVNVLNYVFTLIISRMLGVAAFGEVTALFSLMLIITVPATALTMLMTRQAAVYSIQGTDVIREMFLLLRKNVFLASVIFWLLFMCCVPFLSHFLQIAFLPLFIFSALIPITLAASLQSGTLQGMQEFFMLSKQNILNALIKLFVSIVLVYLGLSVVGVMCGLVLASLASWGYSYLATRSLLVATGDSVVSAAPFSLRSIRALFSTILLTTLLLVLLSNLDVLMAKHFLPADLAGQYGALSTLGKILIYGIGAFITVLLPMVSAAHAEGKEIGQRKGANILALSLSVITGASLFVYVVFSLFPVKIVSILFGARYLPIAPYLATFSIAMACISLVTAFINYFVAVQNHSFIYMLGAGIVVEACLISLSHATLGAITAMLLISSMLLLVLMALNYALFCRAKTI